METYAEFMSRINSFEKRGFSLGMGHFIPSGSVPQKVGEDNTFSSFFGDTVVFDLDEASKSTINCIIDILYQKAPNCFCERLKSETIHLTLHDLSNSPRKEDVTDKLADNYKKIKEIIVKGQIKHDFIRMKSNYIINMVNTSMVLCFYPADELEYNKIMELYETMDNVVHLPYPFTPHVTLAYFNRYGFEAHDTIALEEAVNMLNMFNMEMVLNVDRLFYQRFENMNTFYNFCKLI
jgi:2'-5' RNA ligase